MEADKIRNLIARGEVEDAINVFRLGISDPSHKNTIILICAKYENIKSNNIKGIISHSDYMLEINKINNDLLELLIIVERSKKELTSKSQNIRVPEIILSLINNNCVLETSDEALEVAFKEILFNIEAKKEPFFAVKLMILESQTEWFSKVNSILAENINIILSLENEPDTLENRKEIVQIKEHSKQLTSILKRYEGYKYDLVRKFELFDKIVFNRSTKDKTEIFRWIIHLTFNPSTVRSRTNFINDFSGNEEILPVAVYRRYDPKISFNIYLSKDEVKEVQKTYGFGEGFQDDPAIYLYERSASGLPDKILNQKVYPRIIDEVFALEKRFPQDVEIHEHILGIGSFEIALG